MLDRHIEVVTDRFVKEIKDTEIYRNYIFQLSKMKRDEVLLEQVNEYRRKNFQIQSTSSEEDLFDKMNEFEKEYEQLRENPMVNDFLQAELALCRLMQEINVYITDGLNFE